MSEKQLTIAQRNEIEKKRVFMAKVEAANESFIKMYGNEKAVQVFEKEKTYAQMAANKNPDILNCNPASIVQSVQSVAMTGLSLDPVKQLAHLVPRGGVCTLVVDYKGILELLSKDAGVLCTNGAVYDCDDNVNDFKEGVGGYVNAKRAMPRPKERKLLYCYNVAHFPDGRTHASIMDAEQIAKRREKAQTQKVWNEWEEAMSIKTVIREHYKYLPKSERLDAAMQLIDQELPKFNTERKPDDEFLTEGLSDDVQEGIVVESNQNQTPNNQ
jgi:phage RecT family recombinase